MITLEDKIAGLYIAFYNRAPDKEGFDIWVSQLNNSFADLNDISSGFSQHTTFTNLYGDLSTKAFVEAIYKNILGKDGDEKGILYWSELIDNGTSRSDMISTFVESALSVDLSASSFDYLSPSERTSAEARQDLLENKVEVSLDFMDKFSTATNVADPSSPESDPAYLASIKILSEITEDPASVTTATELISLLAKDSSTAIHTLNNLESITTDETAIKIAQSAITDGDIIDESTAVPFFGGGGGGSIPTTPTVSLSYSADTFLETTTNNGSISGSAIITLVGDTFVGSSGAIIPNVEVTNLPTGLTATVIKVSDTTANLTFSGRANSHANSDDINNLTVSFGDDAFTNSSASTVTGTTKDNLSINFIDADTKEISYSSDTFVEGNSNDGSIISTTTLTLIGDTFVGSIGNSIDATFNNVPVGLTASLIKASDTTATLSFTGKATNHEDANSISNFTISLGNNTFVGADASTVTGASKNDLKINFDDAPIKTLSYSRINFVEGVENDGSVANEATITLVNDEFIGSIGQTLSGVNFSGVPNGLTASIIKTSDTTATLSFTGKAALHENNNDISTSGDLTISFTNSAFLSNKASTVNGAEEVHLSMDFQDRVVKTLTYDTTAFSESGGDDGSVVTTSTLTLTNEEFVGAIGQNISGVEFSNVPNGLTASLVKSSDTTATLSFSGKASAHEDANDVSDLTLTLANSAFVGNDATEFNNATTNLSIDFNDARTVSYSREIFTESSTNDGTLATSTSILTLTNDTFTGDNGSNLAGAIITNVPSGLSYSLIKSSDTTATLSLTGTAGAHADANDISNLTVTLGNSSFSGGNASNIEGAINNHIGVNYANSGAFFNGDSGNNIILGSGLGDIIYGNGGIDDINGAEGDDIIDITSSTGGSTINVSSTANGTDTVIGFREGSNGTVLNFSSIEDLEASVQTGLTVDSNFSANNIFVFDDTEVSISSAANAIAGDNDVVATTGYIVIADADSGGAVTVYHSDNLANNGTETAIVVLSGVNITELTTDNFLV